MKFEVGKMYRVGGDCEETGNVIQITEKRLFHKRKRFYYKTIVGENVEGSEFFDAGSFFADNLTLFSVEEKIVILRNGTIITATHYIDGEKCGTGVAKCSPEDEFDFETGARLAFERLFESPKHAFDWNKFKSGKIAVHVSRETISGFLQECEKMGLGWNSERVATEMNPFVAYDNLEESQKAFVCLMDCEPKENIWIFVHKGKLCFDNRLPESEVFVW